MNKSLLKSTLAFAAAIILFTACKKDKATPITKESLAGSYKFLKVTFTASVGGGEQPADDFLDECERDDIYTLSANGDLVYDDAGEECIAGGDDRTGTWDLPSTTSIVIEGETYELVSFDGSVLVFADDWDFGGGLTGKLKTYVKKQ